MEELTTMSFEVLTKDEAAGRARISRRFLDKQIALGRGGTCQRL